MFQIAAFYHFAPVQSDEIQKLRQEMEDSGRKLGLRGLVIFASEGLNGTICGPSKDVVNSWLESTAHLLGFSTFSPKWSQAPTEPFRRFGVRVRNEIVTLGKPHVQPLRPGSKTHLSPDQWDEMMMGGDAVLVDTRNWYETRIGTFKNALDPKIEEFSEFGDFVAQKLRTGEIRVDQKVMIFCTGGIRCEKAIVEMQASGLKDVYQLDGGILNYLESRQQTKTESQFEGECFVFDHRVAVDQNLQPSAIYTLCPHCGQPADQPIDCVRCESSTRICVSCEAKTTEYQTCSKNCANHVIKSPGRKGKPQITTA